MNIQGIKWYYITRAVGLFVALEQVFFGGPGKDAIIVAAFSLMCYDFVHRQEKSSDLEDDERVERERKEVIRRKRRREQEQKNEKVS